jgi:hypothetical protein
MFGKIIGAVVGSKLAQQTKSVGGSTGAMIGAAAPFVISRLSIPAMVVLGAGGYFTKKYLDKRGKSIPEPTEAKTTPVASIPQPEAANAPQKTAA